MPRYADLVLPLPLDSLFTYEVPAEMQAAVKEGVRAVVHFGKKKYYTGIVVKVYNSEPKEDIKSILSILEEYPIVLPKQLKLWQWIADYYMCTLGDVYKAALPSSLKLESKTFVRLVSDNAVDIPLTPNERKIYYTLSPDKPITVDEVEKKTGLTNVLPYLKSLADKDIIHLSETVQDHYIAKTQSAVRLTKPFGEQELNIILNTLSRAKKQQDLLLKYLEIKEEGIDVILKSDLLAKTDISNNILNELVKRQILEIYEIEKSRFNYGETRLNTAYLLNEHQQKAYTDIKTSFNEKDVCLLFGVTSSGKTEIYIQLIKDAIERGKQVLYLLPEIALTTQITERLKSVFGSKLAVYHSKFNDNERVDIWNNLLKNKEVQIVLGARSALFLPFTDLELVIVDEEHEGSYKQQDPAPRYNARDAAMVLAKIYDAKTLLGTATPSIETYTNALRGRFGLVRLTQRYADIELPQIQVVNVKELRRTKKMKSVLSPMLIDSMSEALEKGEQVILFQNRRGFSSVMECKTCSWTPHCDHCDVSLTYHKQQGVMVCHYCGATYSVPKECPDCQTPTLDTLGYGTERVEEIVSEQFPEANIARMDLDTTRGKRSYERIIADFEAGKTNVLIGTQMISKGLDFDNVSVVGILNADNILNFPDFRSYEKAFQLMTQVSGRAGRKNKQGLVILQTSQPNNPIITQVRGNDYEAFYQTQMGERRLFHYPPYFRLTEVTIRGKNEQIVDAGTRYLSTLLRESFSERVLGPVKPAVARIQSLHIRKIMLKIEIGTSIAQVREVLKHYQSHLVANAQFKSLLIHYDVDPF